MSGHRGILRYRSLAGKPGDPEALVKLRRDGTLFGREKADILIEDKEVSATHFQIQLIDSHYHIFDMNSSNGTFVNGYRIVKSRLSHGDVIGVGKSELIFELVDDAEVRRLTTLYQPQAGQTVGRSVSSIVDTIVMRELNKEHGLALIIEVTYGDGSYEKIHLKQREVIIGRAAVVGHFENDPEMSRRHFRLKLNETGEIFVEDLGSTNGTFLNDKKLRGMQLVRRQDRLKAGLCSFLVYPIKVGTDADIS